MKIAVYTIAKNEEQFVERWAESCKEADYRFILDTGSTDGTVELARSLGIEVAVASISPWRFDDARNVSLSLLPSDIDMCIALDMDEVLLPGWREALEKALPSVTRPRYKYTWSWQPDGSPGLQYNGDKIHSRHGYRWKHPVHEVITPDRLDEVQGWVSLEIHHYPDNTKSRGQYFPLLELAAKESPMDDRTAHYLGREYFYHGRYEEAARELRRHLSLPTALWGPERAQSYRYLAKCEPEKRESHLWAAYAEAKDRREAQVDLAQYYYETEQWEMCLASAEKAIAIEDKPLDYICEEFAWGSLPYDLAAIAAHNLGRNKEAYRYGGIALGFEPDNDRLANNMEYYKS